VIPLSRIQGALDALDDTIPSEGNKATLVPYDLKDFDARGTRARGDPLARKSKGFGLYILPNRARIKTTTRTVPSTPPGA
jgi:hypothetical protein